MVLSAPEEIHVLHVDDEPAFTELVQSFLEREDERLTVEAVPNAEAGLEQLAEGGFDCVVSDYDMPGRNGIEFLHAVRERDSELPFILFTGKGSEEVASDAISAGVTDYLQKGTGNEQYALLANRIRNAVEGRRSREALTERTRRLETLISNVPGMVYRCRNEPGWPMEIVEGEVESLVGHPASALESGDVNWGDDILHPDDRERVWEDVQEALDADGSFEVTYRIVDADGETKWMWERGRYVRGEGEPAALEGFITDISDRKRREQQLEQTTARLEALFEQSPDMVNVHDADGTIIDANAQICRKTGYDESELTGMSVWDIDTAIGPDEAKEIWTSMEPGERRRLRGRYRRQDGTTFPVAVHLRRLDLTGEDRFVVISRDISERVARERDLQRYEQMVNTMPAPACIYDTEGRFETVNDYLARLYDTTPEALEGEPSNLIPELAQESDGDPYQELLDGERDELYGEIEAEFGRAGRTALAYRITPFEINGEVVGAVSVAHDVTELADRERELERTNALLSTVFETLRVGVIAEDGSRKVLAANRELLDLFDLTRDPDELTGRDCAALVEEVSARFEDPEAFVARTDEVVASNEPVHGETFELRDGRTLAVSHEPVDLPNREGRLWMCRDITDQREREAELRRQNERLDEFARVISHDLRNPLTVAMGNLGLAMEECDSDALDSVERAHKRMESLIEDILTLARERDDVETTEGVPLVRLATHCWETVPTADATLRTDTERTVRADPSRLKQLFENLYRNAVEHGGEDVTVTVGDLADGTGFYVADDGPGIPESDRETVFDAGYSTADGGSGFGLNIVTEIVEAHGWEIEVTESESGGARFDIRNVAVEA